VKGDARERRAMGGSLWSLRDFRQLWLGESVSKVGSQLTTLALPVLAVGTLHAGAREMGVLTACEMMAFLVVGLPAGAWVDRWHKRRVLIVNDLLRALALGSIPVAWALHALTLAQLFVVAAIAGIGTVFFDVAYQSYLPHLVASDQLVAGNARLQASESVAQVGGPALGAALLRVVAAPALIGIDAISFLFSAGAIGRIQTPEILPARQTRRPLRVEIAEGMRFVIRHPLLRRITACTSISNFFFSMGFALFVLLLLRDLHLHPSAVGVVFSVWAVGGLVGALVAERAARTVGEGRAIPLSVLAMVPCAAATPIAAMLAPEVPPIPLLAVGGFFAFAFNVIYNVTQVSFRQRVCPPELLGRMNASVRFIVWGTLPIGGLLGGLLGAAIGLVPTFWITVAGELVAAFPVVFSPLISMRELPRTVEAV
jgi:MFS family permease